MSERNFGELCTKCGHYCDPPCWMPAVDPVAAILAVECPRHTEASAHIGRHAYSSSCQACNPRCPGEPGTPCDVAINGGAPMFCASRIRAALTVKP